MNSIIICWFSLTSLVIGFTVSHNADKLLQDNAYKLLQESCPLSTCQK